MYNKKNISKILIFFSCLILIVVLGWYFTDGKNNKKAEGQESENVYIDIQDAEEVEIINSKSDAYQTYRESGETIEDYWNTCEDDLERSNPDETQNTGGGTSEPTAETKQPLRRSARPLLSSTTSGSQVKRLKSVTPSKPS